MISSDELIEFLTHQLPYEQKIVSYIDKNGLQHYINKFSEIPSLNNITLKIEGMERYSSSVWSFCKEVSKELDFNGPMTAHCFYANPNSPSFGKHTDPDDVLIYCTEGIKTLFVEETYFKLNPGDSVFIPANTPHEITNEYKSVILSFGFEKFFIEKLI